MTRTVIIILAFAAVVALSVAYYYLVYKPGLASTGPSDGTPCTIESTGAVRLQSAGTYQNGVCVPSSVPTNTSRITAIQANNILNQYGIKDSAGRPTLHYSGGFDSPDTANFPASQLQSMLRNGWWFGLLTGGTLNGFKPGDNGQYLLAIYDLRDHSASINSGKSQVYIPSTLTPYLIL